MNRSVQVFQSRETMKYSFKTKNQFNLQPENFMFHFPGLTKPGKTL